MHLLTHAWVARAVRLPAVLEVQRARLRDALAVHLPRPLRHRRPALALSRTHVRCCGVPRGTLSLLVTYSSLLSE